MRIESDRGICGGIYPWTTQVSLDGFASNRLHIDNLEIAALFHEARQRFQSALIDRAGSDGFSDQLIAHVSIDFVSELKWRPEVDIVTGIQRVATTSYAVGMVMRSPEQVFAGSSAVLVWTAAGKPRPISQGARAVLELLSIRQCAGGDASQPNKQKAI